MAVDEDWLDFCVGCDHVMCLDTDLLFQNSPQAHDSLSFLCCFKTTPAGFICSPLQLIDSFDQQLRSFFKRSGIEFLISYLTCLFIYVQEQQHHHYSQISQQHTIRAARQAEKSRTGFTNVNASVGFGSLSHSSAFSIAVLSIGWAAAGLLLASSSLRLFILVSAVVGGWIFFFDGDYGDGCTGAIVEN